MRLRLSSRLRDRWGHAGGLPLAMAGGNWPAGYNSTGYRQPATHRHTAVPTRSWGPLFTCLRVFCLNWFCKARAGVRSFRCLWCFPTRALLTSFTSRDTVIKAIISLGSRGLEQEFQTHSKLFFPIYILTNSPSLGQFRVSCVTSARCNPATLRLASLPVEHSSLFPTGKAGPRRGQLQQLARTAGHFSEQGIGPRPQSWSHPPHEAGRVPGASRPGCCVQPAPLGKPRVTDCGRPGRASALRPQAAPSRTAGPSHETPRSTRKQNPRRCQRRQGSLQ